MPRIVGVDIPNEKQIQVALTYIYGIGAHRAKEILNKAGITAATRTKDLSDDELSRINSVVVTSFEEIPGGGSLHRLSATRYPSRHEQTA